MKESTFEYAEDVISKAMMFAISAHSGQFRKHSRTPAIIHAMEAAVVVSTLTSDPNVIAAALLHDTIEDTDVTIDQVRRMFGDRIAELVVVETEDKHSDISPEESWMMRKQESINELSELNDIEGKMVWLGDKLSNMRSFYRMYVKSGKEMWNSFHQKDEKMHEWYYRSILRELSELKDYEAYKEYKWLTEQIFGQVDANES